MNANILEYHQTVKEGGVVVELSPEITVKEVETGSVKARDKRSGLVDRHRALRQVLCYLCCAEFGSNSLLIHQKTCIKKHTWGLDLVEHEEGIPKKQSALNRQKCTEPGSGPAMTVPTSKSNGFQFDAYNAEALRIFYEHSEKCLWCRERNHDAIENAKHAHDTASLVDKEPEPNEIAVVEPVIDEDALRKAAEDEDRQRKHDENELQRALEEAEALRKHEEDEERHRIEEENARKLHEEAIMAATEAARLKEASDAEAYNKALELELDEAKRRSLEDAEALRKKAAEEVEDPDLKLIRELREEEAARRSSVEEETRRRRIVAAGQHKVNQFCTNIYILFFKSLLIYSS